MIIYENKLCIFVSLLFNNCLKGTFKMLEISSSRPKLLSTSLSDNK